MGRSSVLVRLCRYCSEMSVSMLSVLSVCRSTSKVNVFSTQGACHCPLAAFTSMVGQGSLGSLESVFVGNVRRSFVE